MLPSEVIFFWTIGHSAVNSAEGNEIVLPRTQTAYVGRRIRHPSDSDAIARFIESEVGLRTFTLHRSFSVAVHVGSPFHQWTVQRSDAFVFFGAKQWGHCLDWDTCWSACASERDSDTFY